MIGRIIRLPPNKMFGFITTTSGKGDYFFHREDFIGHWTDLVNDFNSSPSDKIEVEFDVVKNSPKGLRATNVKRLDYPN